MENDPVEEVVYENPEHLQPGPRSLMSNLGHLTLSLPLSQAPLGPTRSSALLHPLRTQLSMESLSPKHARFPFLTPSLLFSPSATFPLHLCLLPLLCNINIGPKTPLTCPLMVASGNRVCTVRDFLCWPLLIRPLVGHCHKPDPPESFPTGVSRTCG